MQTSSPALRTSGAGRLCAAALLPLRGNGIATPLQRLTLQRSAGGWSTLRGLAGLPLGPHTRPQAFFETAWSPSTLAGAANLAPQLFAASLLPYLVFLFFLHSSGKAPKLTLFGFYFLLLFVGATIPAGIYAKTHYGTALANVDWLHGSAESLLTITNLLIVLGLRQGIREEEAKKKQREPGTFTEDADTPAPSGQATPAAALEEQAKQ